MSRAAVVVAATGALLGASLVSQPAAQATHGGNYRLNGCKFGATNLKWQDATGVTKYGDGALHGANAWTASATPIYLTKVTSGANVRVETEALPAGDPAAAKTYYVACSAQGTWTATIEWRYNTTVAASLTQTQLNHVAVHEFGHALGLAHYDGNPCHYVEIMDPLSQGLPCGYMYPQNGDVAGINFLY